MKRFRVALASVFLVSVLAGCGGGIEEGMATGEPTQEFKDQLEKQGKMMQMAKYGEKAATAKTKAALEKQKTGP
jgi:hypothetical protein